MEVDGNGTAGQPWSNVSDERKKFRSLKRKYRLLEEENADLSEEVIRARRLISRLQNERTFILDRLLQMEKFYRSSDTDTDTSGGSSSESELDSDGGKRKEGNGLSPLGKRPKLDKKEISVIGTPSAVNADPESLGLCIAVVRDRPCKSKALSGYKYCWHHAPLDPNSPFIWCQFRGTSSKNKKCSIPVLKTKSAPFCKYHMDQGVEQMGPTEKAKKKEKKEKHKKKKDKKKREHKKAGKEKTASEDKTKQEIKELKLKLKALGNGGATSNPGMPEDDVSGSGDDASRHLIITEDESDSDEGMTIVDVEEEEIQF